MKKSVTIVLLGLLIALVVTGAAMAAGSSPNFSIPWDVIGRGGRDMASPNYGINSTIGQNNIGPSGSNNFMLGAGYWYSMGRVTVLVHRLYLPIVVRDVTG
ncbi:MAG: hypothetical protein JW900_14915 [Anaerolineae bacterium]|nr:hypothetical protein [Anaerolineae bacterium]